ncbi:hypothetical protein FJT64_012905 [Amphibalanus amphitrite]|uniref:Uncharacterized protein n=1 Tax=Amphibalanus amphitrite TaxID=1232801 RepID=A0A6A4VE72_AMPAM|nr:hypothetical protein FJT64_012905 [Amphibalanus amphitrite]
MLFVTLGIDDGFLETDPAEWHDDSRYVAAAGKANGITVVNDFAKRGVALMETYNFTLTKDEDQSHPAGGGGTPWKVSKR